MFSLSTDTLKKNHPHTWCLKTSSCYFCWLCGLNELAGCLSLEVSYSFNPMQAEAAVIWRLDWAGCPKCCTHDSWCQLLDYLYLLTILDHLYLVSSCGLDFSSHGSWLPEKSILRVFQESPEEAARFLMTWSQKPRMFLPLHFIGQAVHQGQHSSKERE